MKIYDKIQVEFQEFPRNSQRTLSYQLEEFTSWSAHSGGGRGVGLTRWPLQRPGLTLILHGGPPTLLNPNTGSRYSTHKPSNRDGGLSTGFLSIPR